MRNWKLTVGVVLIIWWVAASDEGLFSSESYITGSLIGQTGNKMFEIAAVSALAWDNGAEACFPDLIPASSEYQHVFFRCNNNPPKNPIAFEWGGPLGYQSIPYQPNMRISGYLQDERYFAHHRARILELFAPRQKDLKYIQKRYGHILSHPKTVSVHLRYYLREKPGEFIQYDKDYYEKAMAIFPDDSLFIVVSDFIPFAKENVPCEGRNVIFIEGEPFYIDFYLQTLCKNNIICNSSFSWWAAWLNQNENKLVVRPKTWLDITDIVGPSDWILIDARDINEMTN